MRSVGVGGTPRGQAAYLFALLHHFVDRKAFFSERTCGAGLHAFAAGGAVARRVPNRL